MQLTPLEIAAGVVTGTEPGVSPIPRKVQGSPRSQLENVIADALRHQPCCVGFSGGRDSSAILALAVHVARREGLPDPIPVTLRYPLIEETNEDEWQSLVIDHMGLNEWHRIEITDELDFIGPYAEQLMRSYGLIWPTNVHAHLPIAQAATGGVVLTGVDGDGLFGGWRWIDLADSVRQWHPRASEIATFIYLQTPGSWRHRRWNGKMFFSSPWLTTSAEQEMSRHWVANEADEPARWRARVKWWARQRFLHLTKRSLELVALQGGATTIHPFLHPPFLSALARQAPILGQGDRTNLLSLLFGDLLPRAVLERSTKARFGKAFWGERTRRLTQEWDGSALDRELVSVEGLKREWDLEKPNSRTAPLVQLLWMNANQGLEPGR